MIRKHYSIPLYTSRGFDLVPDGSFRASGPVLKTLTIVSVDATVGPGAWYDVAPTDLSTLAIGMVGVPTGCDQAANNGAVNPAFVVLDLDQSGNRIRLANTSAVIGGAAGTIAVYAAEANGASADQRSAMIGAIKLPGRSKPGVLKDINLTPCGVYNIDLKDTREDVVECFIAQASLKPFGEWVAGTTQTAVNVWRNGVLSQIAAPANLSALELVPQTGAVPQPDAYPEGAELFVQSVGPRAEYNLTTFARWAKRLKLLAVLPFGVNEARIPEVPLDMAAQYLVIVLSITGNTDDNQIQRAAARLSVTVEHE